MLRTYRTLAATMLAGEAGDVITTMIFLRSGRFPELEEANPFVAHWLNDDQWLWPMLIKGGLVAVILVATYLLMRSPQRKYQVAGTIGLVLNTVLIWAVVAHNLNLMGAL